MIIKKTTGTIPSVPPGFKQQYPNIRKLSESIAEWDGYTTCHGWTASMLLRLIADGKMELAEEFAAIAYEINEQHRSTDKLNDKLDDIVERAGYG